MAYAKPASARLVQADDPSKPSQSISFLIVVAVSRTVLTKWLLSGNDAFSFPVTYSAVSCIATSLTILALAVFGELEVQPLHRRHWRSFLMVAALTALDMGATNIAVESISLALQQTIKATLPVMVVFLERVMTNKTHARLVYLSLVPLTAGPVLAAVGSSKVDFNLAGSLWMVVGVFASGLKSVLLYTAIRDIRADMGMGSFLLWLELSTLVVLLPWSVFNGELTELRDWNKFNDLGEWAIIVSVSLLGGLRAFATTLVLRYSDPISLASANVLIQMTTVVLSIFIFGTHLTVLLLFGTVVSLGGFALFTVAKFTHSLAPADELVTDQHGVPLEGEATSVDKGGVTSETTALLGASHGLGSKHHHQQQQFRRGKGGGGGGPALKKEANKLFTSHNAQLQEYSDERQWAGFGPAGNVLFAEGEAVKVRRPRGYNALMRVLVVAHLLTGAAYLMWISQNLAGSLGLILGPAFLVAEFLSYLMRVVCFTQYWTKQQKIVCPLHRLYPTFPEEQWPTVQFCVTHYKEPVHETYATLKALLEMDYPPDKLEINILDDGYFARRGPGRYDVHEIGLEMTDMIRSTLQSLVRNDGVNEFTWQAGNESRPDAAEQGSHVVEFKHECFPTIRHICRRKGEVSHFKGGNLNNAIFNVLTGSQNQFFAFLDCDMAPTNDFLQLTIPLFLHYDGTFWRPDYVTGMCQAPQSFGNVGSNGSDDPLAQVQDFYWRRTMQHLDRWGLVHYYGTNVVIFRPALEDCMGWQYGVLSEDTPTGANLTQLGWKAVYLDQDVAVGLCKDTVEETLIQRKRWAMGNVMWWILTTPILRFFTSVDFQNPPKWQEQSQKYRRLLREAVDAGQRGYNAGDGDWTEDEDMRSGGGDSEGGYGARFSNEQVDAGCFGGIVIEEFGGVGGADRGSHGRGAQSPRRQSVGRGCDDPESTTGHYDPGLLQRQARMRNWVVSMMHNWSYLHVKCSNQVAAYWFIAYMATAWYMMTMAGESKYTPSSSMNLNVLAPAIHFVVTTTVLYTIGPQSGLWRACQDRFAFAWVRIVAIVESLQMAGGCSAAGPWNAKVGTVLIMPPLAIFGTTLAILVYSSVLCFEHGSDCFEGLSSSSPFEATVPVQLVGLFLGFVVCLSMWPIVRSSVSNICGYPMYKLRLLPAGSTWPYFLALAPLAMVSLLWLVWGTVSTTDTEIFISEATKLTATQLCVSGNIAPSLFVLGCAKCGTTSLFTDMTSVMPQIDPGRRLAAGESTSKIKSKHFFDDKTSFEASGGLAAYFDHYETCSASAELSGSAVTVSADFTESTLESDKSSERIYESYSESERAQLRFLVILRDPVERLFSYFESARADGTLDLTGFEDALSDDCLDDPADCDEVRSLSFETWVNYQVARVDSCLEEDYERALWPHCGTEGLFAGLYSEQLEQVMTYFQAEQIGMVRYESYRDSGPGTLKNVAKWLGLQISLGDMTESSRLQVTDYTDSLTDVTRRTLDDFYDPYTTALYELVGNEGLSFIDTIEKKDLF